MERVPVDRLEPSEWNPRILRTERFRQLVKSLQADPDFLERRPVLAYVTPEQAGELTVE